MATYEYRCRTCDARFELRRSMADSDAPTACPDGHDDVVRLLSSFAALGSPAAGPAAPGPCGGACACNPA